ncbi:MAG: hypothetical protein V1847_04935, partial [Candidatus Diapherotrites archaeon]
ECDAIRFANVSEYMSQSERRKALYNIWKSLKLGGYLLGASLRYSKKEFSGIGGNWRDYQFILIKTKKGFEKIIMGKGRQKK